jgi:aminoglycoside 3-N-acetyltransferase
MTDHSTLKSKQIDLLRLAGVSPGDTVVIQASVKGLGTLGKNLAQLFHAWQSYLTAEGTLIMPAHNFTSWTEDHYFDILETPSKVGFTPEFFRLQEGVRRTQHPIHSVSVWGRHQTEFCSLDYSNSFGEDSIFSKFLAYNAMYLTVGLGLEQPFLHSHYPEHIERVPYRRRKDFSGIYVGYDRVPKLATYCFDVRNFSGKTINFKTHYMMAEEGTVKSFYVGDVRVDYSRAVDYDRSLTGIIRKHPDWFATGKPIDD